MKKITHADNRLLNIPDVTEDAIGFITHNRSRRFIQPIFIAILTTSLATGMLAILDILMPDPGWMALVPIIFLFTLTGVYTTIWLAQPDQRPLNNLTYRIAEIIVMLLLLRVLTWTIADNWPEASRFAEYLRYPLTFFGDNLFIIGTILLLIAWQFSSHFARVFGALAIDMAEATYYLLPSRYRSPDNKPTSIFRGELMQQFFQMWVLGGVLMAIFATLSTFDLNEFSAQSPLGMARLGLPPELLLALLGYFLSGLILLSHARLAAMKARWLMGGVRASDTVDQSWHRNSIWLITAVALIAAFLPLGSTFAIGRILEAILYGATALIGIITTLFLGLLALFFAPMTVDAVPTPAATPVPLPPQPTPVPPVAQPPSDTLGIIGSSAFWTILIVVTVLSISLILRERGVRLNLATVKAAWAWLSVQTRQLWRGARKQVRAAQKAIQQRRQQLAARETEDGQRPFRFLRLNALPPREQVRYFYLATVRRASEQGVERDQSATPLEYADSLKENWPDAETDVDTLTDAFLRARYTPQPITDDDVGPIKALWRGLRGKLRSRKDGD